MAFMALIRGFGLLFCMLLGFGIRLEKRHLDVLFYKGLGFRALGGNSWFAWGEVRL